MTASSSSKAQAPARILLVDDNRSGLAARRMVLEELGYQTTGMQNPSEALALFRKAQASLEPFDLVVTDFKMPELNGVELIQRMREVQPAIPVILISGFVDALGLTERATGANAVIMKSANEVPHLIRTANRLLGGRARRKPPAQAVKPVRARRAGSGGA